MFQLPIVIFPRNNRSRRKSVTFQIERPGNGVGNAKRSGLRTRVGFSNPRRVLTDRTRPGAETDPGMFVRGRYNTFKPTTIEPSRTRFFFFFLLSTYITRRILYTNGNYFCYYDRHPSNQYLLYLGYATR